MLLDKIFSFVFKKYPAYLWNKPNVYKVMLFPVIFYYYIKDKKNE